MNLFKELIKRSESKLLMNKLCWIICSPDLRNKQLESLREQLLANTFI